VDGIADAGGRRELFGPLPPLDPDEPAFPAPWHGRAFALTLLANRTATASNLHALRHALERVPREHYLASYWGRWVRAAELVLAESGLLAPGAVDARIAGVDLPDPEPAPRANPGAAPGNLRHVTARPRHAVGTSVVAASAAVPGHTRLPAYARGRRGTVTAVLPAQVTPDVAAHFGGEAPQHVYAVAFASTELWGPGEEFTVTVDLLESYLAPA